MYPIKENGQFYWDQQPDRGTFQTNRRLEADTPITAPDLWYEFMKPENIIDLEKIIRNRMTVEFGKDVGQQDLTELENIMYLWWQYWQGIGMPLTKEGKNGQLPVPPQFMFQSWAPIDLPDSNEYQYAITKHNGISRESFVLNQLSTAQNGILPDWIRLEDINRIFLETSLNKFMAGVKAQKTYNYLKEDPGRGEVQIQPKFDDQMRTENREFDYRKYYTRDVNFNPNKLWPKTPQKF